LFGCPISALKSCALLTGSQSNALTPSRLLRLSKNLPHDWSEQRHALGFAA
jgi:site-specific DNA recombinase